MVQIDNPNIVMANRSKPDLVTFGTTFTVAINTHAISSADPIAIQRIFKIVPKC